MVPHKLADNYVATMVDEEIVIIDMDGGQLFALKDTGRAIWELIDGKRSSPQIAEEMTEIYEVGRVAAERSIDALLGELGDAGLIAFTA